MFLCFYNVNLQPHNKQALFFQGAKLRKNMMSVQYSFIMILPISG